MNQAILDWQNSFSSFGISYSGPKDGNINPQFISAMIAFERKYKAYGEIFSGQNVKMSAQEAMKKFLGKSQEKQKQSKPTELLSSYDKNQWETFFHSSLPLLGNVYSTDLKTTAKRIEEEITKRIGRNASGMIWNDKTNSPATTMDDIKKALELLKNHEETKPKAAKIKMDDRILAFSKLISVNNEL